MDGMLRQKFVCFLKWVMSTMRWMLVDHVVNEVI